jgi:hypothetical protein
LNNKLEEMHAKLEETNASWKLRLDETNAKLDETNATLQTTMEAVFGVSHAICFFSSFFLTNLFDL